MQIKPKYMQRERILIKGIFLIERRNKSKKKSLHENIFFFILYFFIFNYKDILIFGKELKSIFIKIY